MGARTPRIGITMYGQEEGRYSLPVEYVEAVRRAGGVPLLMAPGETRTGPWIDSIDGVIFAGGGDLAPESYGGAPHDTAYNVDAERDATELELAREILSSDVPAFFICRGLQILNVSLGGTLIEHIPDEVGESVLHRAPPREPITHALTIEAGTRLGALCGALEVDTYSWHHQAIRALGTDLEAIAHAPDGVIEAVHYPNHPWLLAVQWHPELSAASDPTQQRLFDALVEESGRRGA